MAGSDFQEDCTITFLLLEYSKEFVNLKIHYGTSCLRANDAQFDGFEEDI